MIDVERRRARDRKYYYQNLEKRRARVRERSRINRVFVSELKRERGCLRCGTHDVRVLEWHHRDPSQRRFGVGEGTRKRENIIEEIERCDVLCANCHAIEHYKEP